VKRAQNARRDAPTERSSVAAHFDFGNGAFFEFDDSLAAGVTDDAAEKVAQIGIVADEQDGILARVFLEELLEVGKAGLGAQRVLFDELAFVAHFISDQGGGLHGAFERAGNDDLDLHAEGCESAADEAALLDAVFVERALFIFLGACAQAALPGAGVT